MWKKKIWDFKIKLQILLSNLRLNSGVWTVLLHFFLFCKYFTKNCNKSLFIISVKIWSLCEMFVYYTTSVPAPDVAASFQYPFTHFSSISVLTITQPQTHQNSNKQAHTVRQWFKSILLFIKATLRTKKVACQNLFSRRRHRATNWLLFSWYKFFFFFFYSSEYYYH